MNEKSLKERLFGITTEGNGPEEDLAEKPSTRRDWSTLLEGEVNDEDLTIYRV